MTDTEMTADEQAEQNGAQLKQAHELVFELLREPEVHQLPPAFMFHALMYWAISVGRYFAEYDEDQIVTKTREIFEAEKSKKSFLRDKPKPNRSHVS